jgi:hypothetical protein
VIGEQGAEAVNREAGATDRIGAPRIGLARLAAGEGLALATGEER